MSKHTPGPWYWSPDYKTGDGRATWSLIGSDGYGILSCDGEENSPQGLGLSGGANARLIAAAPEMLQMLIYCRDWLQGSEPHRARAVSECITKATGEQP